MALADLCVKCVERTKAAVELLHSMENAKAILDVCNEIDRIESEADRVIARRWPSCSATSRMSGR